MGQPEFTGQLRDQTVGLNSASILTAQVSLTVNPFLLQRGCYAAEHDLWPPRGWIFQQASIRVLDRTILQNRQTDRSGLLGGRRTSHELVVQSCFMAFLHNVQPPFLGPPSFMSLCTGSGGGADVWWAQQGQYPGFISGCSEWSPDHPEKKDAGRSCVWS